MLAGLKSSEDAQDDDKIDDDENAQDDEDEDKNEDDETAQDNKDDDKHDDDENAQDDDLTTYDDETTHEEETNEDDTFDPIVHTPSRVSSSNDEDNDNEVDGVDVEGEKSDEDATDEEDKGNERDKDTNANLEGRDDVMIDSSSVSSGFISNMLNPNQDTGVDAIFGKHAEATSLIDIPVTAIAEPSFFAPTNPLEDNFSEFKQTNQYAKALSSIPGIVNQYLANKMQEAVDVAVQLKYDRIREEAHTKNQQFLDSIDEGIKKVIKEQVKKEVSKITPKIKKLVNKQLESEILVRSSKEAKTSHAVAANLSELKLKKILIDKIQSAPVEETMQSTDVFEAPIPSKFVKSLMCGASISWGRSRLHEGTSTYSWPSITCRNGLKRKRSPQMTSELFANS
ncbi:hypothetical protein Tco_1318157 [Tanacetum coccineum]